MCLNNKLTFYYFYVAYKYTTLTFQVPEEKLFLKDIKL